MEINLKQAQRAAEKYRKVLRVKLPKNRILPEHTDKSHFYRYVPKNEAYPSVTAKLQILKDPSILEFHKNRMADYFFQHFPEMNDQNLLEHIDLAKQLPITDFEQAGAIGTQVHDIRHFWFDRWIVANFKPEIDFGSVTQQDQVISCLRALDKFVKDYNYIPVACEFYLADPDLKLGGTGDDLGVVPVIENGRQHNKLVFIDIKTSNQLKNHYHKQVALYYLMLAKLTGLRPKEAWILKLDKDNATYKVEKLKDIPRLIKGAKKFLEVAAEEELLTADRKKEKIII